MFKEINTNQCIVLLSVLFVFATACGDKKGEDGDGGVDAAPNTDTNPDTSGSATPPAS